MEQRKINRKLLKSNAIAVLKRNFWLPVVVCFIASFLGANWNGFRGSSIGGGSGGGSYHSTSTTTTITDSSSNMTEGLLNAITKEIQGTSKGSDFFFYYDDSLSESDNVKNFYNDVLSYYNITSETVVSTVLIAFGVILLIIVVIELIVTVFVFAAGSFIGAPIGVGYRRFFMKNREGTGQISDLFSVFSSGHYMEVVKNLFATNIRLWGWKLLFYFPGLVKNYEYYMVSYILSENPTLAPERTREISREMTKGHKFQIWVLELSFIGWIFLFVIVEIILAIISCGLLAIPGALIAFVISAYQCATYAELYAERREYMLYSGLATAAELPGFAPAPPQNPLDMSGFYATSNELPNDNVQTNGDSDTNNQF